MSWDLGGKLQSLPSQSGSTHSHLLSQPQLTYPLLATPGDPGAKILQCYFPPDYMARDPKEFIIQEKKMHPRKCHTISMSPHFRGKNSKN